MGGECEECKRHTKSESPMRTATAPSCTAFDFAMVPVRQHRALIVSDPSDPMEHAADHMAERVMNSQSLPRLASTNLRLVQRQVASAASARPDQDEPEDPIASGPGQLIEEAGDESGRPKLAPGADTRATTHRVQVPDGPGTTLQRGTQNFMESRFGYDFSNVRVHGDSAAARSAEQLQAHAYTVGEHIYFAENQYRPDEDQGRRLLAHELTHVVQQRGGEPSLVQRQRRRAGPMDSPRGAGQHRKRQKKLPPCATGDCNGACALPVEPARRNPSCGNETCSGGSAANSSNFIRHLDVDLTTQMVVAELGTAARTASTVSFLSSPNPAVTPPGPHRIGRKCGPCHTNNDAHGMGWFTGFANDLEFGFHNSQRVARGVHSLGCVRVAPCDRAKWIHDNTTSGTTTVCVHRGDHCKPKSKKKAPNRNGETGGTGSAMSPLVSDLEPGMIKPEAAESEMA
jgi:hypothetical protein